MASVAADRGRKLRTRAPAAPPVPPVTRSAVAAASNMATTANRQVEAPRRTETSKVALKKAAHDENRTATSKVALKRAVHDENHGPLRQAKKRVALANLTNCSNVPSTRSIILPKKKQVKLKDRMVAYHCGEVNVGKEYSEATYGRKCIPLIEENARPVQETGLLAVFRPEVPVTAGVATQTIVSSSGTSEHIHAKVKNRQGYVLDDAMEEESWCGKNYTNIDENFRDPQMCSLYAPEIYYHLQIAELKRRPVKNYIEAVQQDINASMRSILVDWLVEVAEEYKLVPDTLYFTISYIDRFLSGNVVHRQRLQLLGITCMFIASKYEEICPPLVDDFCFITDKTYVQEEVLEMEKRVLNYLQFQLSGPTTKTFLRRFIRAAQAGQKTPTLSLEFLSNFLAELTLLEYGFLKYLPSMIAAAAIFLAKVTIAPATIPWTPTLQYYTGYKPSELKECIRAIHDLQCNKKNCTLTAVWEKYKQPKFKSVANLPPALVIPLKYFEDVEVTA